MLCIFGVGCHWIFECHWIFLTSHLSNNDDLLSFIKSDDNHLVKLIKLEKEEEEAIRNVTNWKWQWTTTKQH